MKKFRRKFTADSLNEHVGDDRSLIGALLERWVLPGETGSMDVPLRLAVRDGYLNLYANGQSVAKISAPNGKPRIDVHWKYTGGVRKVKGEKPVALGKTYEKFDDEFRSSDATAIVDQWIHTAATYAGDEKRFVEHLVAANANVIDLEMGLPGDPTFKSTRPERKGKDGLFAPRMDVVVVNATANGHSIEFWEAKLATNGELRAETRPDSPEHLPHVVHQLGDYTRWISRRTDEVALAYYQTAADLTALAALAGKSGVASCIWAGVADKPLTVRPRPGLIIADYDPDGTSERQMRKAQSFAPHRRKLELLSCHVRQVTSSECVQAVLCAIDSMDAA